MSALDETFWSGVGSGNIDEIRKAVESGADPGFCKDGTNALVLSIQKGFTDVLKYLLTLEVDVNYLTEEAKNPLMYAIEKGSQETVQLLLARKVDLDAEDQDGKTAWMYAAEQGSLEILNLLKDAGVDHCRVSESNGASALMYAAAKGHPRVLEYLMTLDTEIDWAAVDYSNRNVLIYAAEGGSVEVLQILLNVGVELRRTFEEATATMIAAESGHLDFVKLLLQTVDSDINAEDYEGTSVLLYAARGGSSELVQFLLDAGADVNHVTRSGETALMQAAKLGHLAVVQKLLPVSDIHATNEQDCTALMFASIEGHFDVVKCLLNAAGGDVGAAESGKRNALHCAAEYGHFEIVKLLLAAGFDVKALDKRGASPVYYAAVHSLELVQLLLDAGADVKVAKKFGYTALMNAAYRGSVAVMELLVKAGAEVNAVGEDNTALTAAISEGREDVIKWLLAAGADAKVVVKDRTTVNQAVDGGLSVEIVELLIQAGADVTIPNAYDDKPTLIMALEMDRSVEMVECLLRAGADANTVYEDRSALMIAIEQDECSVEVVQCLVNAGAKDSAALPVVVESYDAEMVKVLITSLSSEPELCAKCMLEVVTKGEMEMVKVFLDAGVSVTPECMTAAIQNGSLDLVQALLCAGGVSVIAEHPELLVTAVKKGSTQIVKLFLDSGVSVKDLPEDLLEGSNVEMLDLLLKAGAINGESAMSTAARSGSIEMAQWLLDSGLIKDVNLGADSYIFSAIEARQVAMVQLLLKAGTKVDILDKEQHSVLFPAARCGSLDIVKLLVDAGADVNHNIHGKTPLMIAVDGGHRPIQDFLTKAGADVAFSNKHHTLLRGLEKGDAGMVRAMVELGADLLFETSDGRYPMKVAVTSGSAEMVQLLFDLGAKAKSHTGAECMFLAATKGDFDLVNLFLKAGGDVNAEERYDHRSLLMIAVELGLTEVVKSLVAAGAEINFRGSQSNTSLNVAASKGHVETAKVLLELGANVNNTNSSGMNSLMIAAEQGYLEMVQLLLQWRSDFSKRRSGNYYTVLDLATMGGHLEVVKCLLKAGVALNELPDEDWKKNVKGSLSLAAEVGNVALVQLLLASGADLTVHKAAIAFAVMKGHVEVVRMLLNAGASPNTVLGMGYSNSLYDPLVTAVEQKSVELVRLLLNAGSDPNENKKYPALVKAAELGLLEVCDLLLKAGADVNGVDEKGNSALSMAAQHSVELVQMLLSAGADVYYERNGSCVALAAALQLKTVDVAMLLLAHGAFHSVIDGVHTVSPVFTDTKHRPVKDAICSTDFLTLSVCEKNSYDIWFQLTQVSDVEGVVDIARSLVTRHPELALVKDAKGRSVTDLATPAVRLAINSMTLWFGKYRPAAGKPEHTSATCFVIKAMDESTGEGEPVPVALKLMRVKAQFLRETEMRKYGFDGDFVMTQSECYPAGPLTESDPDVVEVRSSAEVSGVLTKAQAEGLYCVVMPLADRNMFVAMKQERFAGKEDVSEVVTIFTQLVKCVMHVHGKGVLHGDIKPMNLVRMGGKWILIDLDACCGIGRDSVGFKSSSAYVPPECVFADVAGGVVGVKSESLCQEHGVVPLTAHESFDVWSLGCILYQFCSAGVLPLFAANQDDNLNTDEKDAENSLWALSGWSDALKEKKLSKVSNLKARNLLSLMLSRDPAKRPTLSRVLGHPFLSGDSSGRMAGEAAEFDVFISYRVASDLKHAARLYEMLTGAGLRVWWDKKCLESGKEWQKGFCQGLGSSAALLCILSRAGTEVPFESLQVESRCDNVLLEHRLALELKQIDYVKYVFPIMIGEENVTAAASADVSDGERYSLYRSSYNESRSHVAAVEETLAAHLDELGLGTPLMHRPSVYDVANDIRACNGYFIGGKPEHSFEKAVQGIVAALKQQQQQSATVDGAAAVVNGSQAASKVAVTLRAVVSESKPQGVMTMEEHESVRAQYEAQLEMQIKLLRAIEEEEVEFMRERDMWCTKCHEQEAAVKT